MAVDVRSMFVAAGSAKALEEGRQPVDGQRKAEEAYRSWCDNEGVGRETLTKTWG